MENPRNRPTTNPDWNVLLIRHVISFHMSARERKKTADRCG